MLLLVLTLLLLPTPGHATVGAAGASQPFRVHASQPFSIHASQPFSIHASQPFSLWLLARIR